MQEISIQVKPKGTYLLGQVGHAWVKTPNMQKGLYPSASCWHSGLFGPCAGDIRDDSSTKSDPQNSYTYKACPESIFKFEKNIQENEENIPDYNALNTSARNCCGWACEMVETTGFKAPFFPKAPRLGLVLLSIENMDQVGVLNNIFYI